MKRMLTLCLCLAFLLCGCMNVPSGGTASSTENTDNGSTSASQTLEAPNFDQNDTDMFTDRDNRIEYDGDGIKIELRGTSAAASSNSVKIDGTTITITEDETHIISGTLDNGQIIVNVPDTAKIQLVFENANITSETSAPLYIKEADKVFITLVGKNTLANGGSFEAIDENNIDGAIYSKQDITFNGEGSLTVTSPAGHGIVGKDDLVITSGTYKINSASHALDANDSVRITNADLTLVAGKDGIHAENNDDTALGYVYISSGTLDITAEGDGISAGAYMQIEDGDFEILAGGGYENGSQASSGGWGGFPGGGSWGGGSFGGGGKPRNGASSTTETDTSSSMKGLKAVNSILVAGGTFKIDSADDAIHSNNELIINGGTFEIASGDDGVHADTTLTINDCDMIITHSYEGLEALNLYVKGGTIDLTASDDGLNAAGGTDGSGMGGRDEMFGGGFWGGTSSGNRGAIEISGGKLIVNASGDGIDSNGTITVSGGETYVSGPTNSGNGALDYDGSATVTGGIFLAAGATGMAQNFGSSSTQGAMLVNISGSAGSTLKLTDESGKVLIEWTADKSFGCVVLSSPEIVQGKTYTVSVGSNQTAVTMTSLIYGASGGFGGMGGFGGRP